MKNELISIIKKFADSGWDLIDKPAKAWLDGKDGKDAKKLSADLIAAIEIADQQCGSCGCEFDPLYKKVLESKHLFLS